MEFSGIINDKPSDELSIKAKPGRVQSYLTDRALVQTRPNGQRGVFARAAIRKDELVAMWGGVIYKKQELERLPQVLRHFPLQIDEDLFIAPEDIDDIDDAEYFNHSCEPNCGIRGQIALVAMRDIRAGEELTFDYAMAECIDQDFICECGSSSCRKHITKGDCLNPVLMEKYRGYFSYHIEKKQKALYKNKDILMQYEATGAWGLDTALDLNDCDPAIIRSADKIKEFTIQLCDKIRVKRFGEPIIVHFGENERVAGYSLVQLIETSLISGHFANLTNKAYIDIFSCAYYNPKDAAEFAVKFFKAKSYTIHSLLRR